MILDKFKIDNTVAIVTGAARGLGQGFALALGEAGTNVALKEGRKELLLTDFFQCVRIF